MPKQPRGTLHVVATPIGNLGDIGQRSRDVLSAADLIACEDTRVTGMLLKHLEINHRPLLSYRDENETSRATALLEQLHEGKSIALVSDAGTPAISDPGFRIVRACRREGIQVVPIPGACAAIAALSASGIPSDRFFFVGFLPPKSSARRRFLQEHLTFPSTIVLYESVHRIGKLMDEIVDILGTTRVVGVAREITKRFESSFTGQAGEVRDFVESSARKGEYVVLIAPEGFDL